MAFMGKPSIAKDSTSLDEKRSKTQLHAYKTPQRATYAFHSLTLQMVGGSHGEASCYRRLQPLRVMIPKVTKTDRSDIHFLSPQHLTFSPLEPSPWSQQPVKEVFHKARITWLLHQPSCFEFHPTEKDNSPGKTTGHTHPAPLITMSTVID